MASNAANRRGVWLMLLAMACYSLNDACLKWMLGHHPHGQVLAVRGLYSLTVVTALAWRDNTKDQWRNAWHPLVAARAVLEAAAALASVAALSSTPLPTVTALMMSSPLIIALAAMALGWERPNMWRITATLVGLAGVLLVARPFAREAMTWGVAWSLGLAATLAARDLVTRRMPQRVPSGCVAMTATAAACVGGVVLGTRETWPVLAQGEAVGLAAAALCVGMGNLALISACRDAELSVVAPFRYSILVWAMLLGYAGWNDTPDLLAMIGVGLIAAGGLMAIRSAQSH